MHTTDGEENSTSKQEQPLASADAGDHMGQPRKANPSDEDYWKQLFHHVSLNFVLVDAVITTPVVHVNHWVAVHGGGMTSASTDNLVPLRLDGGVTELWDKPNAS
jgi:hypothetical protein